MLGIRWYQKGHHFKLFESLSFSNRICKERNGLVSVHKLSRSLVGRGLKRVSGQLTIWVN